MSHNMYYCVKCRQVSGCTVLTICDGQLAVPAGKYTLCGYVLEYYLALSVCLSQLMFVILPYSSCYCNWLHSADTL
jgi:hypothetical protein